MLSKKIEIYNPSDVEVYSTYEIRKEKTRSLFPPTVFIRYGKHKRKEVLFSNYGYINMAADIICISPKNPKFNVIFTDGPEKTRLETKRKKFWEAVSWYTEKPPIKIQEILIQYLTNRRFINKIKNNYSKLCEIDRKIGILEKQRTMLEGRIYVSEERLKILEGKLYEEIGKGEALKKLKKAL